MIDVYKRQAQLSRFRPYDLVILSYGLNVVSAQDNDDSYDWYYAAMAKSIEHIQQLYPHADSYTHLDVYKRQVRLLLLHR